MIIKTLIPFTDEWNTVRDFAFNCSWRAGKALANSMDNNEFSDFERVIAAFENDEICAYCTVAKTDCIPDVPYTPYVGFVFVDEKYRGNRLSEKMIDFAVSYLKSCGFDKVYLTSDHINLYEKYGFKVIDRKMASWGEMEKIYMKEI